MENSSDYQKRVVVLKNNTPQKFTIHYVNEVGENSTIRLNGHTKQVVTITKEFLEAVEPYMKRNLVTY